jgi:hypothetical protein
VARTIANLATRVLERLFVLEAGETADANDQAAVISAFNDWLDGLFADGLTPYADETITTPVALTEGTTYISTDTFPILDRHFEGVSAILAVELQNDFEAQLNGSTYRRALIGEQRIEAAFKPSFVSTLDRGLLRLPSSVLWPSSS